MKLIRKYRIFTYTSLTMVVIIAFVANYYLFRYSIHRTTDDVLNEYRIDVENYALDYGTLEPLSALNTKLTVIDIYDWKNSDEEVDETISDTLLYSHYEKEMVVYRKLVFPVRTQEKNYLVRIMLPTLEEDDLIETVILSLLLVVVLFIIFSTMIDWAFSKQIFHPFNRILETMKTYHVEHRHKIRFENTDIDEFAELNFILTGMISKINQGYDDMKNFLEHTSHELKTPLAIIQLKIEALNQTSFEDEQVRIHLHSIQVALNRIIRFNRSLLFIAKIKNDQFATREEINLTEQVVQHISQYQELLSIRGINVSCQRHDNFLVHMHPILAEHLIQNMLINAIKHNTEEGSIEIICTRHSVTIQNTYEGDIPEGNLFDKYTRATHDKDSNGLGLSIVQNICEKSGLTVHYRTSGHIFIICVEKENDHPTNE